MNTHTHQVEHIWEKPYRYRCVLCGQKLKILSGVIVTKKPALVLRATPIKGRDLKPGDLFSTAGPEYWDHVGERDSVGERAYIRTETPAHSEDLDMMVYLIEVIR